MKIRTLFIGTSDFGIPTLDALLKQDWIEVVGIVTQPDRPVGRKQIMTPPAIKQHILDNNYDLEIVQPEKIRLASQEILEKFKPELIIVVSYGQIIPDDILNYPKYKCLNIHGSLLPKLRGAVPVHMAILQGFESTGVTLQRMVKEMDAGGTITNYELRITREETTESLLKKLSELSVRFVTDDLKDYVDGKLEEVPQDDNEATFCYMKDIAKENAEIRFETDVDLAERMVRAFVPWPVSWFKLERGVVKIFRARKSITNYELREEDQEIEARNQELETRVATLNSELLIPNSKDTQLKAQSSQQTLFKEDGKLFLQLHDGVLELQELQLEGKNRGGAKDYLFLVK